jgi:GYF domain 2
MAGWYYAHGDDKLGPFSGDQLKELAAAGTILPTDTVWRDGTATGVSANRVVNLFAPSAPAIVVVAEPPPLVTTKPTERPKRGSASALKGAEITGQDGVDARFRMICTTCGTKDASCRTIKISNKTTKSNYFCPKCRKRREVVIQCRIG